jgi:hypothetical protein
VESWQIAAHLGVLETSWQKCILRVALPAFRGKPVLMNIIGFVAGNAKVARTTPLLS